MYVNPNKFLLSEEEEARNRLEERRVSETRICSRCGREALLTEFSGRILRHMESLHVSFLTSCRKCRSEKTNKDSRKSKDGDPAYAMAHAYWARSRRAGVKSDLTIEDVRTFASCPCFYCETRSGKMGLEMKDPHGGYVRTNVLPCCERCAALKSDMPKDAWKVLVPAVRTAVKAGLFGKWKYSGECPFIRNGKEKSR